jgi:prepilin-type N-terminal cleavage/methylation domain-containing protein/prepilin-type processing-associated H-X9-DG protein
MTQHVAKWTGASGRNARCVGFTLIELLVVIAIISLLVTILMPSLEQAKKLTREVVCQHNLRSLGAMFAVHVSESHYPAFPQMNPYGNVPGLEFWYETISQGGSPSGLPLWCPLDSASLQRIEDQGRSLHEPWYYISYAYNGHGLGGLQDPPWIAAKFDSTLTQGEDIARPAETVLLSDGAINPDSPGERPGWAKARSYPDPWNGNPYPRHEDRCYTLWTDGHVSHVTAVDGTWRSLYWEPPDGFGDARHDAEENTWDRE